MSLAPSRPERRWRKTFASLTAALLISGCVPSGGPTAQSQKPAVALAEDGRVYALVETAQNAGAVQRAARDLGYTPRGTIALSGLGLVMVPVDLPAATQGSTAINALERAVPASTVGVNHAYHLQQASAAPAPRSYANALMRWPAGGCTAQTAIGLIDGGLDSTAAHFSGVALKTRSLARGSARSIRHGTEVASVMVDPSRLRNVSLYSAEVTAANAAGEDIAGAAALVQALDWMARENVSLVNISLAGPRNKLLAQAVQAATAQGMQIVAAVGNNGRRAPAQYPAALPGVLAVTAVDARARVFRDAVRGEHVDIAAPGVDILVPSPSGPRYVSGTSMAAPFVTAFLATQPARGREALLQSALDLGPSGRDKTYGHGLVQTPDRCP